MRAKKTTIPSTFVKLDTNVTTADNCVNAHDQHVFRQNHNALFANRVRKNLMAQAHGYGAGVTLSGALFWSRYAPEQSSAASRMISVPVFLTQWTRSVTFWCYANKTPIYEEESTLDEDPLLYVVLHEPHIAAVGDITANVITVTTDQSAAPELYTVTVNVPEPSGENTLTYGRVPYILDVYLQGFVDHTAVAIGATAITDVDRTSFTMGTLINPIQYVVRASSSYIEARTVVYATTIGASYKMFIDKPWSRVPVVGTDTISAYEMQGIRLYSYGAYENPVAAFTDEVAE